MTVLSFNYWYERQNGNPIETPLQSYFAENYSDEFMSERFQTMVALRRPCETWESMIASTYHLGIDVGSTTAKAVVFDPLAQRVLFSRYVRHNAHQVETVASLLRTVAKEFPECSFRLVAWRSGGHYHRRRPRRALRAGSRCELACRAPRPRERAAARSSSAGQDAKMVFFERDEKSGANTVADMRMNGSCAGGTGAFIDEMAALLKVPVEQFDELAARGQSVHQVSGRCGVYAKTDIQPLLNQGVSKEDLALSSFHAIAKQTIGGLAPGPRHPSARHLRGRPANLQPDARARVR